MSTLNRTGTSSLAQLTLCAALATAVASCGYPLGRCEQERIELRGTTTTDRAGQTLTDDVFATFAPGNNPQQYPAVRRFLIDAAPRAGEAVVWTIPAFRVNGGHIAVILSGPLRVGDDVPVAGAFEGGGWGTATASADASATVSVRADDFVANSASGTITVLGVTPLRLRLDITATSAARAVVRIRGELAFSLVRESAPCT